MNEVSLELVRGNITTLRVDAIVNAANGSLLGGGGVDGAIHAAAGRALLEECRALPLVDGVRCPTGEARMTGGHALRCKWVIHTVGPVYNGKKDCATLLASCYTSCLHLAGERGLESIAFPNISTGIYGYPKGEAARVAVDTVRGEAGKHPTLKRVVFVCFDGENYALYKDLLGL
ncbi:MAG: O-acetyl-ADP-ribose deacetylase [Spirochaetaceae bacterium]|jgi:O-acetyl-ADP-ribose deacetylase (regulator of RNase III)|nr:O-acetyl-ADP-ribose deacetylase [Spirochaetaceae bacterium]